MPWLNEPRGKWLTEIITIKPKSDPYNCFTISPLSLKVPLIPLQDEDVPWRVPLGSPPLASAAGRPMACTGSHRPEAWPPRLHHRRPARFRGPCSGPKLRQRRSNASQHSGRETLGENNVHLKARRSIKKAKTTQGHAAPLVFLVRVSQFFCASRRVH